MDFVDDADVATYLGDTQITARHVYAAQEANAWVASELNLQPSLLTSTPISETLYVEGGYIASIVPINTVTSLTVNGSAVDYKVISYWVIRIPKGCGTASVTYTTWDATTLPAGVKNAALAYAAAVATYRSGDVQSESVGQVSYTYRNTYESSVSRAGVLLNPYRRFLPC